jgi:phosphotransferase system HPr-like phosphotransfer protein
MSASAASIMDLLMLGARVGQTVEIDAEGPEARKPLEAVATLSAASSTRKTKPSGPIARG